ncbi:hypothetical protein GCM10011418_32920 [Sphingobacterium alkalisoli]|uniref:hypothetical protein n=1 Tax=Sphingobacterium alkalisoli TaxID=1874115 RepID=UPI00145C6AAD|nr:hypothetical protein [Sphingobacterium alkalisoli]GGH24773.1 hypothetical protein GCM10011418_32920 [Sphingobacterium alkalisoli]
MTRKQLEGIIFFVACYDGSCDDAEIKENFGIDNVSSLAREEAITAYLEVNNIKLDKEG